MGSTVDVMIAAMVSFKRLGGVCDTTTRLEVLAICPSAPIVVPVVALVLLSWWMGLPRSPMYNITPSCSFPVCATSVSQHWCSYPYQPAPIFQ
jgi:hypothetical protein